MAYRGVIRLQAICHAYAYASPARLTGGSKNQHPRDRTLLRPTHAQRSKIGLKD